MRNVFHLIDNGDGRITSEEFLDAMLKGAYIVRNGEKLPVNLRRIGDGRESDLVMQPGDQLFIKESPL